MNIAKCNNIILKNKNNSLLPYPLIKFIYELNSKCVLKLKKNYTVYAATYIHEFFLILLIYKSLL